MSSTGGSLGLGITFHPELETTNSSPPVYYNIHGQPQYPHQPDYHHRVMRHSVSYDVGLNRRAWEQGSHHHHGPVSQPMLRLESSESGGRRVRISAREPQVMDDGKDGLGRSHQHQHVLSPLSDFDTTSASDSYDFSPASLSSLPSSSNSVSAYKPYEDARYDHQQQRLAKSMGSLTYHDGRPLAPPMETAQSRPYPPPIDLVLPSERAPAPAPTHYDAVAEFNDSPPPVASTRQPSRLPAFLRERVKLREHGLSRPKSMMELGELYAIQASQDAENDARELTSEAMLRTSTSHSGMGNEADGELSGGDASPESIPSSAGGLQRRHFERQLLRHQQLEREAQVRQYEESQRKSAIIARPRVRSRSRSHSRPRSMSTSSSSGAELVNRRSFASMRGAEAGAGFIEMDSTSGTLVPGEDIEPSLTSVDLQRGDDTVIATDALEGAHGLNRSVTLLTAGANPARRSKELDRLLAPTNTKKSSNSTSLATIADSPTPSASSSSAATASTRQRPQSRASSRVPVATASPVVLEQAKSASKARVELDLTLESALVVEGGLVKGKIEIRVRKPKERESDVWLGRPKVRVVGFEELSSNSDARHIFYHHAATVSAIEERSGALSPLPCVNSDADDEGFQQGVPGQHLVPFKMRLPVGKGAKGGWKGKQGVVRYIVIASVKLKSPAGGERSIAHFYRHVEIFPYFNPAVVLAPSLKVLSATASKSLFMGGSGTVDLTARLHRATWVAGQRCYVDISVNNQTSKKIKTLTLSLVRTTTLFRPRPWLNTGQARDGGSAAEVDIDADACQTQSTRKKVAEETLEMGKKVNKGVTAKGSWMGVEPGEDADFSHSMLVPTDALTILRGRYLEVTFVLKVSVGGSLSADVSAEIPIRVVNFISLDPPPGHSGEPFPLPSTTHHLAKTWSIDQLRPPKTRADELREAPKMSRMASLDSLRLSDLNGGRGPSRAGMSSLSRVASLDSLRTADLSRGQSPESGGVEMTRGATLPLFSDAERDRQKAGEAIVGRAKERQLSHQMSLDCISSAIASATARRQGHQRTESSLRSELTPSSAAVEEWDDEAQAQEVPEGEMYYGGGGEQAYGGVEVYGGPYEVYSLGDANSVQLDDLDDIPDDVPQPETAHEYRSPQSELDIGDESEDELDAMLVQTRMAEEVEARAAEGHLPPIRRPRSSSLRSQTSPPTTFSAGSATPSTSPVVRSRPSSPVKAALDRPQATLPKSAMKQRRETFGFATPSSPIRATVALPPSPSRKVSPPTLSSAVLGAKPSGRGPLPPRPDTTSRSPSSPTKQQDVASPSSRAMSKQPSTSSLKRTSALVKKPSSTRSLRSNVSPTLSHPSDHAPELDSSSVKSSPDVDTVTMPPTTSQATIATTRDDSAGIRTSPRKVKSPTLHTTRSTGELRRGPTVPVPFRRNTVVLPSVRSKVAALETRQEVLNNLAKASNKTQSSTSVARANSIVSNAASEDSYHGLERADSMASFRAPILRRHTYKEV